VVDSFPFSISAFKKLGDYVHTEYMNHLRPNPGISSLPYGAEMYQGFLEYHTSMSGKNNDFHQNFNFIPSLACPTLP
jgi:uncharacterized protein (DUF885 family)